MVGLPPRTAISCPTRAAENLDGILLLGGSFSLAVSQNRQQPHFNSTSERLYSFLQLSREHPDARLVFTGGSGSPTDQQTKEADLAREVFLNLGVPEDRIVFERDSRNTYENARNTAALIAPDSDEQWLLITSASHMPRSIGVFCEHGWRMIPFPVDYQSLKDRLFRINPDFVGNLGVLNTAFHEWAGLFAYRLTGKTNRLLPGSEHNCSI